MIVDLKCALNPMTGVLIRRREDTTETESFS